MNNKKNGNGLKNMVTRTKALGGQVHIESKAGRGTRIHGTIPVTNISYTGS